VTTEPAHTPVHHGSSRAGLAAPLLVVAVAFCFQTGSALATRVISSLGILDALWLRTAIAAMILVAVRPRSLKLPPKGSRRPITLLALSLLAMNLSFYGAISYAPLGIVVAIEFLGPLAVAVMGMRRKLDFLWVGLALGGVVVLAGPTSSVSTLGLGLSLVAACSWGTFLVLAKRAVTIMPPLNVTTLMLTGSALLLTPALAVWGPRMVHHPSAVALGVAVSVLSSALPYFVELIALRLVRAATYGVLLSLEPAVAALMGFVVAGQSLALLEIAAIVAVMIAAAGASWTSRPRPTGLEIG
jgi:inner membrane transporter RhtA